MPVATDAVSQTKYIGAVVGAQIDPDTVINWKMADGTFVTLDAQAITAVAMAVRAHVQACFDRLPGRRPDLVVRFGRGPVLPMSLRRQPQQVIIQT